MAIQTEPTRIQIPFADSGTKNVIPDTNSTPSASQAASWTDGFPAQCSLPLSAGGIPPARADFNGIFNTMTQSIRYGQEGGVWAWDATVDYGTNRLVLGSDGLLYWSIAQSGPNVGGAQNPTTDVSRTYWGPVFMTSPSILDDSSRIATTRWTRAAIEPAAIYVDGTNGSDSNNGLTQASAVKTLTQALTMANKRTRFEKVIYVSSNTYSEDIQISGYFVRFIFQGDVTLNGSLTLGDQAVVVVEGEQNTYKFDVVKNNAYPVNLRNTSFFYSTIPMSITTTGAEFAVVASQNSFFSCSSTLAISATNTTTYIVNVNLHSGFFCSGMCTVTGSGNSSAFGITNNSQANFAGGVDVGSGVLTGRALFVAYGSACTFNGGSVSLYGINGNTIDIQSNSSVYITTDCTSFSITKESSSGGTALTVSTSSSLYCIRSAGTSISITCNGATELIHADNCGVCRLDGSGGTLTLSGTVSGSTVQVYNNGVVVISSSFTVSGTVTGKRYNATFGGMINVNNTGANRIPGTVAGTVNSTSFGYYG